MSSSSASSSGVGPDDTGLEQAEADNCFPVAFVGHGAPLLALDTIKGAELTAWGRILGRPKAILVISAHWETAVPTLGTYTQKPLIYDFAGFPAELYDIQYPAPGAPELFEVVHELLGARYEVAHQPDRGLDHGVWVPMVHLYRYADVPILQLSLPQDASGEELFDLGQNLAMLSNNGILLLASGNLTHNLRQCDLTNSTPTPMWALNFDMWCVEVLRTRNFDALIDFKMSAPSLETAHPTHEHFMPLLIAAGAACANNLEATFPIEGFEYGTLSRRCVQFE